MADHVRCFARMLLRLTLMGTNCFAHSDQLSGLMSFFEGQCLRRNETLGKSSPVLLKSKKVEMDTTDAARR